MSHAQPPPNSGTIQSPNGQPWPPPARSRWRFLPWILTGLFALWSLGSCVALLGGGTSGTAAAPAATVTEQAAPQPTKTVVKTDTKAEVPQSCLDALDHADTAFTLAGEGFGLASESMGVFQAVIQIVVDGLGSGDFDTSGIEDQTAKLEKINGKMDRLGTKLEKTNGPYVKAKEECRAAAGE
jgi:hypothetical protein